MDDATDAEDGDDRSGNGAASAGTDPFGRAIYDFHRDEQDAPLYQRDGPQVREHPIEEFYFGVAGGERVERLADRFEGPLVDLGAGTGRDALFFQERFETVAVEVSERLVRTMDERGVEQPRLGDMFALRDRFPRDRFRGVNAYGTQVGLAGSIAGLRQFLGDLAHVTTPDATAAIDGYDPERGDAGEMLGYRHDPTPGLATRVMSFEYEDERGPILQFRLFGPDRLREACPGTGWRIDDVRYGDGYHYLAVLERR